MSRMDGRLRLEGESADYKIRGFHSRNEEMNVQHRDHPPPIHRIRAIRRAYRGFTGSFHGKHWRTNHWRKSNGNLVDLSSVRWQLPSGNGVLQILLRRRTDFSHSKGFSGKGHDAAGTAGKNPQCRAQKRQSDDFGVGLAKA